MKDLHSWEAQKKITASVKQLFYIFSQTEKKTLDMVGDMRNISIVTQA